MALKRINPTEVIKLCSLQDEAIDTEATGKENLKKYEESYDLSLLKFKADMHPTIFHVKNVLSNEEAKIKQDHIKIEYPELEVFSKQNLNGKKKKAEDLKPKFKQVNQQEMLIKYFNAAIETAEENGETFPVSADMFSFPVIQELGSIVMVRTQLGDLKNVLKS